MFCRSYGILCVFVARMFIIDLQAFLKHLNVFYVIAFILCVHHPCVCRTNDFIAFFSFPNYLISIMVPLKPLTNFRFKNFSMVYRTF
jgi:hypothetical protein